MTSPNAAVPSIAVPVRLTERTLAVVSVRISPSSATPSPSRSCHTRNSANLASSAESSPSLLLSNARKPSRSDFAPATSLMKLISPTLLTVPFPSRSRNKKPSVLPIQLVSSAKPSSSRSKRALLSAAESVFTPLPSKSRIIGELTDTVLPHLNCSFSIPLIMSVPSSPSTVGWLSTILTVPALVTIE